MPTASGAVGSADRGPEPGASDRTKTYKPVTRNFNSYLQRFEEIQRRKKVKDDRSQGIKEKAEPGEEGSEGAGGGIPVEDGSGEDHTSGAPLSGDGSKKSRLCVVL